MKNRDFTAEALQIWFRSSALSTEARRWHCQIPAQGENVPEAFRNRRAAQVPRQACDLKPRPFKEQWLFWRRSGSHLPPEWTQEYGLPQETGVCTPQKLERVKVLPDSCLSPPELRARHQPATPPREREGSSSGYLFTSWCFARISLRPALVFLPRYKISDEGRQFCLVWKVRPSDP